MRIAVDFDGTIVEHSYPQIGKEKLFAVETLKELQKRGHFLILWTYRSGEALEEAVGFCRSRGLEFYAVNRNYPEEVFDDSISRKIDADIYIDDKNLGGVPGWAEVWRMLNNQPEIDIKEERKRLPSRRKFYRTWLGKLFLKKSGKNEK